MKDELFGTLKWTRRDLWEGRATFPYLGAFGGAMRELEEVTAPRPATAPDPEAAEKQRAAQAQLDHYLKTLSRDDQAKYASLLDGLRREATGDSAARYAEMAEAQERAREQRNREEGELLRRGACDLMIDTAGKRSKPTAAQRAAWNALLARGEAVWDEMLAEAVAVYARQVSRRREAWRRTYGDHLLSRHLPEAASVGAMKTLVRPRLLRIKAAPKGAATADITAHVLCTWHADGFGVVIRDGRVVEIGPAGDVVHAEATPRVTIEHPVFGTVRRIPDDDPWEVIDQWQKPTGDKGGFDGAKRGGPWPWEGRTRFDPLLDFMYVADRRAEFVHDPDRADPPASHLAWEFAGGEFDLRVYAGRGDAPTEAQASAFAALRSSQRECAAEMIQTIFEQYQQARDARRRNWQERYRDDVLPELAAPTGLRDLIQLRHIHVHPADADGRVTIAFQFVAVYDYDGITALWRDGRFEAWGAWRDARPKDAE